MFNDLKEAINWLENKKKKKKREDLSRITDLAKQLDIYNLNFKIIHIAGTNGKGSTAMYINNILLDLGYKVGLFTSPYIIKFNERIILNNQYIDDLDLLNLINYLYPIINDYEKEKDDLVPFFEILFLITLLYFKKNNIDYAVIECGLGGLLDSTNFVKPICSIITSIGYDHEKTLGPTIYDIARHKAGIIKRNTPIISIKNNITDNYLKEVAKLNNSPIYLLDDLTNSASINNGVDFIYKNTKYHTNLRGLFQANNASLMLKFLDIFFPDTSYDLIQNSLAKASIPCRYEIIDNYILDGAHNISAVKELVKTLIKENKVNICCIFSSLNDKAYDLVLKELDKVVSKYVFPKFNDSRQTDPNVFSKLTSKPSIVVSNISEALKKSKDLTLITGSLHFVSSVRHLLKP